MRFKPFFWIVFSTLIIACVEPYSSPEIKVPVDFLVVDGFINTSANSATVDLSRAVPLDTNKVTNPISGATVWIESEHNLDFPLSEQQAGRYTISNSIFDIDLKYRLHIKIATEEYVSAYVELKRTPEIDSVTFEEDNDALRIAVNTHQEDNSGRYYKWDYIETWEYETTFVTNYKLVNGAPVHRTPDEYYQRCYATAESKRILLSNTAALSQDVINDFTLTRVPAGTFQLSRRYSINVKQRALTESEYQYWLQLQRTSEALGTLFDPQPGQVTGNIRDINDDRIVLGYFGGGEVSEKRLFVELSELTERLKKLTMNSICNDMDKQLILLADLPTIKNLLLLEPYAPPGGDIIGYIVSYPKCTDCRIYGGVTQKPDFW